MSLRATVAALDKLPVDMSPTTRLVAVALADHVNEATNECWPSIETICRRVRRQRRQVRRCLRELEAAGVIRRDARYDRGRQTTNRYIWLLL